MIKKLLKNIANIFKANEKEKFAIDVEKANTEELLIYIQVSSSIHSYSEQLLLSAKGVQKSIEEKDDMARMVFTYYSLAFLYKIEREIPNLQIHGELLESMFELSNKTPLEDININPMRKSCEIILKLYEFSEGEQKIRLKEDIKTAILQYDKFDTNATVSKEDEEFFVSFREVFLS